MDLIKEILSTTENKIIVLIKILDTTGRILQETEILFLHYDKITIKPINPCTRYCKPQRRPYGGTCTTEQTQNKRSDTFNNQNQTSFKMITIVY